MSSIQLPAPCTLSAHNATRLARRPVSIEQEQDPQCKLKFFCVSLYRAHALRASQRVGDTLPFNEHLLDCLQPSTAGDIAMRDDCAPLCESSSETHREGFSYVFHIFE